MRLWTVDGKVRRVGRSLTDGVARLSDVMTEEVVEVCAINSLHQCIALFEVEHGVELSQCLVVVGCCQTALIALWVE